MGRVTKPIRRIRERGNSSAICAAAAETREWPFNWILHQFSLMHCEERGRRRRAVVQPWRQLWRKMQLHLAAELALAFRWLHELCSRLGKHRCKRKGLEYMALPFLSVTPCPGSLFPGKIFTPFQPRSNCNRGRWTLAQPPLLTTCHRRLLSHTLETF